MSSGSNPQTLRVGVGVLVFRPLSSTGDYLHIESNDTPRTCASTRCLLKDAKLSSWQGILFACRIKVTSLGCGEWALPGGLLEFGESFEECAARELYEETGILTRDQGIVPQFEYAVNTVFDDNNQCVTIFMSVRVPRDVIVQNKEPQKHSDWIFVPWEEISSQKNPAYLPLFTPLKTLCDVSKVTNQ